MKKFAIVVLVVLTIASCQKHSNGYTGTGPGSLWPLKAGNTWIYQDTVFSDTAVTGIYPDTILVNGLVKQDNSGYYYSGVSNANGWFGLGSYISVDPSNYTIYEMDSPSYNPYIFFQLTGFDGGVIGTGSDYTNPACPLQSVQYGFASGTTISGYSCYENLQYITDCNNVTREAIAYYMSPGVGVVRVEDYLADTTHNNNLYLHFSQTLKSQTLH